MHLRNRFRRIRSVHDAWSLQTAWVMACGAIPWAFLDPDRLRFMVLYAVLSAGFLCIGGPRARPFRRAMLGGSVGVLAVQLRPEWTPSMSFGGEMLKVCFEVAAFGVAGAIVLFARWRFGGGLPRLLGSRDAGEASDSVLELGASNHPSAKMSEIEASLR